MGGGEEGAVGSSGKYSKVVRSRSRHWRLVLHYSNHRLCVGAAAVGAGAVCVADCVSLKSPHLDSFQ